MTALPDPGVDAMLEEGLVSYGLGNFQAAAEKWNKVLEIDPDNSQAIEYLDIVGEEIEASSHPEESDDSERKSPSPMPELKDVEIPELSSKGLSLLQGGNPENAYNVFLEAINAGANTPEVFGYLEMARAGRLEYYRRLMPELEKIPKISMDYDLIKRLNLGKEEGFILSQIDGITSFRDILSLTRMERLDAMGILAKLIFAGIIQSA